MTYEIYTVQTEYGSGLLRYRDDAMSDNWMYNASRINHSVYAWATSLAIF